MEDEESGEMERKWLRHRFRDFCLQYVYASTVQIDDIHIADRRQQYIHVTSMDHIYSHGLASRVGKAQSNSETASNNEAQR